MILDNKEYETFVNLFTNVMSYVAVEMSSTAKLVKRIKINQTSGMGAILYILLQQNVLKEFLVEKTYFDKTNSLKATEPIDADHHTQDATATFNWSDANKNNRTDIINWEMFLSKESLNMMTNEHYEVKNKVERGT